MARHVLLVHSNPVDERDAEFCDWYDHEHVPAVLTVPGFVSARRFAAQPAVHGEMPPYRYLAIYEIDTNDLPSALAALAAATKGMHISTAFDPAHTTFAYTAVGDPQHAAQ